MLNYSEHHSQQSSTIVGTNDVTDIISGRMVTSVTILPETLTHTVQEQVLYLTLFAAAAYWLSMLICWQKMAENGRDLTIEGKVRIICPWICVYIQKTWQSLQVMSISNVIFTLWGFIF